MQLRPPTILILCNTIQIWMTPIYPISKLPTIETILIRDNPAIDVNYNLETLEAEKQYLVSKLNLARGNNRQ